MEKKSKSRILLILILFSLMPDLIKSQTLISYDSISIQIDKRLEASSLYKRDQIEIDKENIFHLVDLQPAFGVYKDTYFTTGGPLNRSVNRNTADVLFQISIR